MEAQKRSVLSGLLICFSRVIPLESDPRAHPLWRLAEQFGGRCCEGVVEAATHVVATHGGTEKVRLRLLFGLCLVCACLCLLWSDAGQLAQVSKTES
jgi:hypothetical protein